MPLFSICCDDPLERKYTLEACCYDSICIINSIPMTSDLIIPGLVTNGNAKICCRGLILVLFNSTMVIKNRFG